MRMFSAKHLRKVGGETGQKQKQSRNFCINMTQLVEFKILKSIKITLKPHYSNEVYNPEKNIGLS